MTQQAAQAFIDAYFAGFPRVRGFIDQTLEDARRTGVVKTMFGRRRLVPELTSRNGQIRAGAERVAVNMPIQGTAADILKRAMIDVDARAGGAPPRRADDPHGARRTAVRGADRRGRRQVAALVKATMAGAVTAPRAARRGRRDRRELEGREALDGRRQLERCGIDRASASAL